jgi:dihydrofolate reductase
MTPAAARRVLNLHDQPPPAGAGAPLTLAVIAAVAANGVIGANNRLPWRLPEDLRRFRALTTGHAVIMGRRTWQSIGRALPGRQNIVVTRDGSFVAPGAQIARSLEEAVALVRMPQPAFVIGGGVLYRDALPRARTLYLTEIARDFDGDARFPPFDRGGWRECGREPMRAGPPDDFDYAFVTYERRRSTGET